MVTPRGMHRGSVVSYNCVYSSQIFSDCVYLHMGKLC